MKATALLVSVSFAVSACGFTPQGDALRTGIATRGAEAYDEGLTNAEWFICQAASVGSVKRRYGATPEQAAAWRALCEGQEGVDLIGPAP